MLFSFEVKVYENGVVVSPNGLLSSRARVFDKSHIEDALTEMYQHCVEDWKVGDRVKIVQKET